jgi:hypothetical protein
MVACGLRAHLEVMAQNLVILLYFCLEIFFPRLIP